MSDMLNEQLTVAVTGASGYVGSVLVDALKAEGLAVRELVRSVRNSNQVLFRLGQALEASQLADVDVLIHAAWDMQTGDPKRLLETNVTGSKKLFDAAKAAGVKHIIFISSISAFDGCQSNYGQTKLLVEKVALAANATVVRPGLIYGNLQTIGGMFGALVGLMEKLPILPVFYPDPPIYMCHEQDLARLVVSRVHYPQGPEILTAAYPEPISFKGMLRSIAQMRAKKILLMPIPWRLVYVPIRLFEFLGIKTGFKSDSLLSLMNPVQQPSFSVNPVEFREPWLVTEQRVANE